MCPELQPGNPPLLLDREAERGGLLSVAGAHAHGDPVRAEAESQDPPDREVLLLRDQHLHHGRGQDPQDP